MLLGCRCCVLCCMLVWKVLSYFCFCYIFFYGAVHLIYRKKNLYFTQIQTVWVHEKSLCVYYTWIKTKLRRSQHISMQHVGLITKCGIVQNKMNIKLLFVSYFVCQRWTFWLLPCIFEYILLHYELFHWKMLCIILATHYVSYSLITWNTTNSSTIMFEILLF